MTAQVMPLNMADMSDEKLADFFFAKALTDDEPEGEPPTIPKDRWRLTPTELEFIRAAASPAERQRKGGRTMVDRWAGICDVGRMAELVRREPALLQSVGPLLLRATVAMRGCAPVNQVPAGPRRTQFSSPRRATTAYTRPLGPGRAPRISAMSLSLVPPTLLGSRSSSPTRGWPDNISLLYWAAASRNGADLTKLLLQYGADPEVRFKGNGERGNTAPAGGGCPRWLRMDSREAPNGTRTDRLGRALRRALRLRLGRTSIACANVQQT